MRRLVKIVLIGIVLVLSLNIFSSECNTFFNEDISTLKTDMQHQYQNQYEDRSFADKIELYGKTSKIPVLMYHHLLEANDKKLENGLILTTQEFEKQMEYLYRNDYTTITIRELELFLNNKLDLPKKSVLITFDDGYKSNFLYAYPILKWYGFKASIALIPKLMPEETEAFNPARLGCLSWQEVELGSDVFEYVNHSYSHASMKEISYKSAKAEIKQGNDMIDTKYFVYPMGHTSANSDKALRTLNYKLAFTTRPGFVKKSSPRLYLPRQRVFAGMSMSEFEDLLQ